MYCSECGTRIPADGHFCPNCGHNADGTLAATADGANIPKKKMALWKKVLISLAAVIAIAVFLALYFTAGLTGVVDRQLALLSEGRISTAYEETASAFRSSTSADQFEAFVKAYPVLSSGPEASFSQRSVENGVGTLIGTLTAPDGSVQPVTYKFIKENDEWRIIAMEMSVP